MKKTVALIIALCLVVLAFVPSIPSKAASSADIQIKTYDSVDGFYSDTDLNRAQQFVTNYSPLSNNVYPSLETLYGYLNSYQWDSTKDLYVVFVSRYSDTLTVWEMDSSLVGDPFLVVSNSTIPSGTIVNTNYNMLLFANRSSASWYIGRAGTLSLNSTSPSWSYSNEGIYAGNGNSGLVLREYTQEQLLCANIPCFLNWDIVQNGGSAVGTSSNNFYSADKSSYKNFLSPDLPYSDDQGNIVDPSGGEAEVNTALAFDVFNSQVVYNQMNKTFTSANISWDLNPMGRTILETYPATEWDMKFTCQVTYNMSSYRPNNQTTPLQSYANGFTFTGTYGFEDYDSIMDGQIYGIDPIKGFETLSDAEISSAVNPDCNLFFALLGAMKGNYASGNSYTSGKKGFSWLGGSILNNWAQFGTVVGGFGAAVLQCEALTGQNGREWLEDHLSGDYIYMLDNFTMNVQAWFECGSIKSQSGYTDIDFVNHTTSSYAPRAYETEEGVNPTIPDPYTNTNDVPVEPGGLDANGVVVYVPVNVEVNVPSGGGDNTVTSGDNSIINNNNPTFNPVFNNNNENSVESLSDLIGEDAATANNGIGGFLDPFKNNSMVTLTGEYFGIVPEGLRTVLIAAIGILIILGIYRFIRRG